KKGRPVLDLRPEDIAVTDTGSEVKISTLRLVTSESDSDHLLAFVFDPLDSVAASNSRDIAAKILKIVPEKGFSFAVLKAEGRLKLYQNYTTNRSHLDTAIRLATDADKDRKENGADLPERRLKAIARTGADESGNQAKDKESAQARAILAAIEDSQRILR